jgi:hypothetical protein
MLTPCASCAHPERCSYAGCARDTAWLCETSSTVFPNTAPASDRAPCAERALANARSGVSSLTAAGAAPAAPAGFLGEVLA